MVVLLLAYGIAFVLENNKHVHVHFVLATAQVSLIWLILLSVALGLLLGVLLSQLYRRRAPAPLARPAAARPRRSPPARRS